jgi:murein DD-endopeptidase MepM/ murein hydrolase activator NlpD
MRRSPGPVAALLVLAAVALCAPAGGTPALAKDAADASVGVCTRKDDFAKRQEAMDAKVLAVTREKDDAKRKKLAAALAAAEGDIECLIRYREPALVPAFTEILAKSKKWFTRTRALYALKMAGDPSVVPTIAPALADKDAMVREAAANALGVLGGDAARKALEARKAAETDPYVAATIDAALGPMSKRPWASRSDGKEWKETLAGPEGARRVEWAWVVKGASLFNDYEAGALDVPVATRFVYPVQRYEEDLFAGYPRNSFGAGGNHGGEDCAWFREGCSYYAIADGVVRMVQGAGGDWGFLVVVEHRLADGRYVTSVYGHSGFDVLVKPGDRVTCGQRIATQGLSCAVENGGYGSHLHFGLGDGPFRRPSKVAQGDVIEFDAGGKSVKGPVVRLGYSTTRKNEYGWPALVGVCRAPDGAEVEVPFPPEPAQQELAWFQAYVKDCRGWLNPQKLLPEWVAAKPARK